MILKEIIKKIVPLSVQKKGWEYQEITKNNPLKREILLYLKKNIVDSDMKEVYSFLKKNPFSIFPYNFIKKYNHNSIQVYADDDCDMKYVLHEGKRLYFRSELEKEEIQKCYNQLLLEQDINSPHRYEYDSFKVNSGDIVVDVGAAEGNFALSVVERAEKLYLFEAEKTWIPALEKTFAPWKDKVVIVNKYVSDMNTDTEICLGDYFEGEKINFLKIDVEGAETKALNKKGRSILSTQRNIKIAVCTYHRQNDAQEINKLLQDNKFSTEFSKGYMIFIYDENLTVPYLRRGLIRGVKQE